MGVEIEAILYQSNSFHGLRKSGMHNVFFRRALQATAIQLL